MRPKPRKPIELAPDLAEDLESVLADAIKEKIGDGLWRKSDSQDLTIALKDFPLSKTDRERAARLVAEVVDAKCIAVEEGTRMFFEDAAQAYKAIDDFLNRTFVVKGRKRFLFAVED